MTTARSVRSSRNCDSRWREQHRQSCPGQMLVAAALAAQAMFSVHGFQSLRGLTQQLINSTIGQVIHPLTLSLPTMTLDPAPVDTVCGSQFINLAHIYYDLGYYLGVKGDFQAAVDVLKQTYALIQEWNPSYLSPFISGFLGLAIVRVGRIGDGVSLLEKANAEYQSMGLGLFRSLVGVHLAEALYRDKRIDDARTTALDALALARRRGERGHEAYALHQLGVIELHTAATQTESL